MDSSLITNTLPSLCNTQMPPPACCQTKTYAWSIPKRARVGMGARHGKAEITGNKQPYDWQNKQYMKHKNILQSLNENPFTNLITLRGG